MSRATSSRLAVAAALLVALVFAFPAGAEVLSDKAHNYSMELPTGWTRAPAADKDGIVAAAKRTLEKLADGKPSQGQGAQAHLSVVPAPEGKSLTDLAADPAQREFLMRLFGAASAWPSIEVTETKVKGEVGGEAPAVRLEAKGKALNLQADEGPCRGILLLTIVKKKLYRLRLIAWTSTHDDEGLGYDLDAIEINFQLLDASEEKVKAPRPEGGGKPGDDPNASDTADGDSGEEKVLQDPVAGWKLVKPLKIKTKEVDKETYPYVVAMFEGVDPGGSATFTLSAYPNGMIVNGQQVPDQDIRKWITTSWWSLLLANHPDGALETFDFPGTRPNQSFLVLPDFEKPRMIAETPKKRVLEPSQGDIEKKFKMVESVKGMLGKEKAGDPWRGVCRGNRPRVGQEISLRYAWRTVKFTYMLEAAIRGEGLPKYGPVLAKLLASIELTK